MGAIDPYQEQYQQEDPPRTGFNTPSITPIQIGAFVSSIGGLGLASALHMSAAKFGHLVNVIETGVPSLLFADAGIRWHRGKHAMEIAKAKKMEALPPEAVAPAVVADPELAVAELPDELPELAPAEPDA